MSLGARRSTGTTGIPLLAAAILLVLPTCTSAQNQEYVAERYDKHEFEIPMRDGATLFTSVYVPKDHSRRYPFLMRRTPYRVAPYGEHLYPGNVGPGGSRRFADEGYIFVYQDVRGRFMSEGVFRNMTPHDSGAPGPDGDINESTDTYDTIEWLLENVQPNNGRVGLWGISYPGFYVAASIINSHPAIKAASPQAPIGDWFIGDDFHHHGAFFLLDAFRFFYFFRSYRPERIRTWPRPMDFGSDDAYQFFLDLGPLENATERYFHHEIVFWDSLMTHGSYDAFWRSRNIIPHMEGVTTAVMTVAGWFDAEDPYGPIEIYQSTERQNPGINNTLVVGPWIHGGWARVTGDALGDARFGQPTGEFYRDSVDIAFFNYYLKDKGELDLPEALVFATGSNAWHRLDAWPPRDLTTTSLYLRDGAGLAFDEPTTSGEAYDEYLSDPANPVPYTQEVTIGRTVEYMTEDQRFAGRRPDVLVYQTDVLEEDITFAGPITADLFVSTTGTDADFVVKLIDVYPQDAPEVEEPHFHVPMGGYQQLVRAEVFRAKFRNSYEEPEPLAPGEVAHVRFDTPHIFHTFKAGHRIMVQVQSSWFPLVDRNPQTFVDIYSASEEDFQAATHRVWRSAEHPSRIVIGRMRD